MADSEPISSREFSRVQAESIHRKGVIKDLRAKLDAATAQIAERDTAIKTLEASVASVTTEKDALHAKLTAAPSELQQELDKLKGELRTRDYRSKFDHVSKDLIRPDGLDAAWKLAAINTDADEVNEDELKKTIGSLVESNPFLKADPVGSQTDGGAAKSAAVLTRPAGQGLNRGGVSASGDDSSPASQAKRFPTPGRIA